MRTLRQAHKLQRNLVGEAAAAEATVINRLAASATFFVAIVALAFPAFATQSVQLVDQAGHRFTLGSLRGKPVALTFVAAHCSDACPLINAQFEQADQLLAREHVDAHLLTITLDPEHDPPAVMRGLARRFEANPRRWQMASGSVRDVHTVMSAFGVRAVRGRDGYPDVHTTFVYVFDKTGALRKTILASTVLGTEIADEIRKTDR